MHHITLWTVSQLALDDKLLLMALKSVGVLMILPMEPGDLLSLWSLHSPFYIIVSHNTLCLMGKLHLTKWKLNLWDPEILFGSQRNQPNLSSSVPGRDQVAVPLWPTLGSQSLETLRSIQRSLWPAGLPRPRHHMSPPPIPTALGRKWAGASELLNHWVLPKHLSVTR